MNETHKQTHNPGTSKAARLKHVVRLARRGEGIPDEMAPGRLLRAAHAVVSVATGNPTTAEIKRADAAYHRERLAQFDMAARAAQGQNREVVAILREAAEMPGQKVTQAIGLSHTLPRDYRPGRPDQIGKVHYGRNFSLNGYDHNKPFSGSVPLRSASGRETVLTIDSRSSAANPVNIRVNTVSIWYEAPAVIEGERHATYVSGVLPGRTTIRINDPEHKEPAYDRMYVKRPGMPAEINRDGTPDGEVVISLNEQGVVDYVALGRMNSVNPVELRDPQVDVAGLLAGLRSDVFATNHADAVPDSPAGLFPPQQ